MQELQEFLHISKYVLLNSLSEKSTPEFSNFILKEATDYQILSLLLETKIPIKYDEKNEGKLLNELYRQVSVGCKYLSEQRVAKMQAVAMAVPTAPLTLPAIDLLRKIGTATGAAALASKLSIGYLGSLTGGIGALVLASLLIYAAWKTYDRFFSPAARSCKKLKGREKTKCILKFKIDARTRQRLDLVSARHACNRSKTPIKCNRLVREKIEYLTKKILKLREKLEKVSH